ncbi:hypothetical protein VTK73DRAFT_9331 [Phialemonium thermophilum]|uniref:Uncharacterized protein n=1 Tax=Phialemonium thermophilum TaxID=223376 RepID=A0ABR3W3H3_9PEZI
MGPESEDLHGWDHDPPAFPDSLRKKRILLCTESWGPVNGVSRTTSMLVRYLRDHGTTVTVVAPRAEDTAPADPSAAPQGPRPSSSAPWAVDEVRLPGSVLPFNPEMAVVYPFRLSTLYRRALLDGTPDLVYLASPASLGFQVLFQLRQWPARDQPPVLCNFQTDLAGYCAVLFPRPLSDVAAFAFGAVQGYLFRHPSVRAVFYPSRFAARYLEGIGVPAVRSEMLQRGVDTQLFSPTRRSAAFRRSVVGARDGELVLLCVARLAAEKGFEFLAAVARELDARGLPFRLCVVGGNANPAIVADVQSLFRPLQHKRRVVFMGFLFGEDLAVAYASADLFLHCSVTETFGLVVLEAMASGVPVVARDEGGPSDIVKDGESGYLVPPGDLSGFVDRVLSVANDEPRRRDLGRRARRQAEETTWDRINSKVAWKIAHCIAESEAHRRARDQEGGNPGRSSRLRAAATSARLAWSLAVISAFWLAVTGYLFVSRIQRWIA